MSQMSKYCLFIEAYLQVLRRLCRDLHTLPFPGQGIMISSYPLETNAKLQSHTSYSLLLGSLPFILSFCAGYLQYSSARLSFEYTNTDTHTQPPQETHSCFAKQWEYKSPHCYNMSSWVFRIHQGESFYNGVKEKKIKHSALNLQFITSVTPFRVYIRQRQVDQAGHFLVNSERGGYKSLAFQLPLGT